MSQKPFSFVELQQQLDSERRLVSFDSYDMTIRQIYDMFVEGAIFVPPEYQRQFVWDEARESELIESIFLGIPVPSLFMATNPDATWEIVDGVQRLSTIAHFVGDSSKLLGTINRKAPLGVAGLEKLSALNDLTFSELPKSMQLMFMTRPIRVTVLNDKSDLNVRFDLFERLNTGGVLLTNQEIRNCIYRGPFNDSLRKIAALNDFKQVVRLREGDTKNGTSEEYVLRYFAYLYNYNNFEKSVKDFLNNYMKENSSKLIPSSKINLFKKVLSALATAFPKGITRGQSTITPANLFEALSVGTALAIQAGIDPDTKKLRDLVSNKELKKLTTAGTNNKRMVSGRIELVRDYLL
ncbi:DUF262 domain-containing protein [Paraburkholderia sp. Tr-20389]|uniref:DUF262 domain-containing protein n=1 Tax=Paraburkholderia sp. Tr-20389 TaxID=2703903 RepID=UPI00197DBDE3|nr:DUF262 domain-containing protein [Paraburkholderia sp. Tr-20389]MBN3754485.1 DUF262 domain-containing protein [Paraburkholderia sp. Tr-20389]